MDNCLFCKIINGEIPSNKVYEDDEVVIGKIFTVINKIANEFKLDNGYRIVNNCGEDGGQEVMHIHFHLLGGKKLGMNN